MKNFFVSCLFSVILPLGASAAELIPATNLPLNSPDGLTDLRSLRGELSVYCRYSAGIFFPESKSCGEKTQAVSVNANGIVEIPAIEKFDGFRGAKTENYEVSLRIFDGEEYLALLNARGAAALRNFKFENRPLALYRLNAASLNISVDGRHFFGSDLSKIDRASLVVAIEDKNNKNMNVDDVLVISSMQLTWLRENLKSYEGKKILSEETSVEIAKSNFAKFHGTADETLRVYAYFRFSEEGSSTYNQTVYKGQAEVALAPRALQDIRTIEIEKE